VTTLTRPSRRTTAIGSLLTVTAALAAFAGPSQAATNPLAGWHLWVVPHSAAAAAATSDPSHATLYNKIAKTPRGVWFTGGTPAQVRQAVASDLAQAASVGQVPVLVAYDIPRRDCGGYSSGGATSATAYREWIAAFAAGLGTRHAVVIVEPDALAGMSCLSAAEQSTRLSLLRNAAGLLHEHPEAVAYLDAGHSGWVAPSVIAGRLRAAGVGSVRGFSLNVSNFDWTLSERSYGDTVSAATGGSHFVIDTSRNGRGPTSDGQWCNPPGRGLGLRPTTTTGDVRADALIWVKVPGESDGVCGSGQPPAGAWWSAGALALASRASW
jgi:endoglucanase